MRKRKDNLDRALERIHERTPRFFSQWCTVCNDEVKGEPMWWVRTYDWGEPDKVWVCKRCAPDIDDLIRAVPRPFKGVDFSPCYDDKANAERNERLGITDADV